MAEMDGLRKRVELVDVRLKQAHSARESESAALVQTWEQIRERFQDQSAEITKLRNQIADLEDSREDLQKMVHSLLSAVEVGLDSMADETVPQIKGMAGELLSQNGDVIGLSQPSSDLISGPVNSSGEPNFHDDLLTAIEQTINDADQEDFAEDKIQSKGPEVLSQTDKSEPASPGIRNLISRIENAVGEDFLEPTLVSHDENVQDDDDLNRDLREIEALRDELHGLRHRIAASG